MTTSSDTLPAPTIGDPRLPDRFWAKVRVNEETSCWEWTASLNPSGYGQMKVSGTPRTAHRLAYAALIGVIPEGRELDHLCRVRRCCNPLHLDPVTRLEHVHRSLLVISAQNALKTHCPRGHEYTPENTWRNTAGHRWCRMCHRLSQRRSKARKAALREALREKDTP